MSEDLNYYIMFPSFTSSTATPKGQETTVGSVENPKDEFVFVYEDAERPVVVLLGWAGCQDKYLAKYSAIYEEKSFITLRYIAPVECLFWRRDKLPLIGRRLLQVISDKNLNQHPIFFHIFSNGGALLYQHISLAMEQMKCDIKVKGVIFDSAPGERRVTSLYKAISAIVGGHPVANVPVSFFITIFLSLLWLYEIIAHAWGKPHLIPTNPISLSEEPHSWPQLFLYSNVDTLIPAVDVERFASRRAERGVQVQLVLFMDSPHVKHYVVYRDVYVNIVSKFINSCLTTKPGMLFKSSSSMEDDDFRSAFKESSSKLTKRIVLPHEASSKLFLSE
ncbi:transmembrane protein 53 [Chelonus insularis]|uniref:transmembrane protein 53 n=1 Tax=Chelonus insularis TaxID=460826 RepID=UPI001589F53D|nr:transmembrane protein 53 [Chelonus insularis]